MRDSEYIRFNALMSRWVLALPTESWGVFLFMDDKDKVVIYCDSCNNCAMGNDLCFKLHKECEGPKCEDYEPIDMQLL